MRDRFILMWIHRLATTASGAWRAWSSLSDSVHVSRMCMHKHAEIIFRGRDSIRPMRQAVRHADRKGNFVRACGIGPLKQKEKMNG
mmetsp:Transcript_32880/g.65109  ORF Transcript_32880/g.65109 Transcript_32880/m.65109 type:complete len:86 (+) Transcript_32880:666-923(+)